MIKEWKIFLTALMFLTRIPVKGVDDMGVYLRSARRYFPLVGWIVGGLSVLVYLVVSRYISSEVGILASMITGWLVTGAFHEDGWADVCDGFGGGWTKEKILLIMKDSRLGTYGVIGLIGILGLKFLLLRELPSFTPSLDHPTSLIFFNYRFFIASVIAAHSISRLMAVLVMQYGVYASDPSQSKAPALASGGQGLSFPALLVAIVFGVAPLFFLPWAFSLALVPALYVTYRLYRYFVKWIGGYTGDCLGAVQQVTEIVVYLGFIIVWRYL